MDFFIMHEVASRIDSWPQPQSADAWEMVRAMAECAEVSTLQFPVGSAGRWQQDSGEGSVWIKYVAAKGDCVVVVDAGMVTA